MDQQLMREIIASGSASLNQLAEAAKTTGEHLYAVLVRQQVVYGIMGLLGLVLGLILYFVPVYFLFKWAAKEDSTDSIGFALALSGILFLIVLIVVLMITDFTAHLINPEYYAIEFIFKSIKGN